MIRTVTCEDSSGVEYQASINPAYIEYTEPMTLVYPLMTRTHHLHSVAMASGKKLYMSADQLEILLGVDRPSKSPTFYHTVPELK